MPPVIIFCSTGLEHLIYCVWSVRSLLKFGYDAIEIIVNEAWEKDFIESHVHGISCEVVKTDVMNYSMWAFRPFALNKYKIKHADRDIVICDTDILWKKDPAPLFNRFRNKNWVQKITSLNPADFGMNIGTVPKSRIGLRTMINYKNKSGLKGYPNFHLNCGLFMLRKDVFPKVVEDWCSKIKALPPKEMIMTEALLSLVYTEMNLSPCCDRENIKHLGMHHDKANVPIVPFLIAKRGKCELTGYETAQHYYGDQRKNLIKDALFMGLDNDNLYLLLKKELFKKKLKKLPMMPKKAFYRLMNLKRDKKKTVYCIVDNRHWVQYRRFKHLSSTISMYKLKLFTKNEFLFLWRLGFLRKKFIYFSSWRITHAFIKRNPGIFTDDDFKYFMAAVTSHSNIGGGLDPLNPVGKRTPEEAFDLALKLLKKFKVVSVNSKILYELLKGNITSLLYCPNGVNTTFFNEDSIKKYDPACIKIGWVGKIRGPKNFSAVEEAFKRLESLGGFELKMVKVPKVFKKAPFSSVKMKDFYSGIDFYVCASWNEGTPNPALEAGACGIPVVTTRVGNMRELVKHGENGFFIEPTADSIVEQFKTIKGLTSEDYKKMSENIRSSIAWDWSWDMRKRNFNEAFARLVS